MSNYSTYPGIFACKTCKEQVKTVRVYPQTGKATWKCINNHISEAQLYIVGYKKKKDYERKERE